MSVVFNPDATPPETRAEVFEALRRFWFLCRVEASVIYLPDWLWEIWRQFLLDEASGAAGGAWPTSLPCEAFGCRLEASDEFRIA